MRNICIIPARSGSKRIRNKNIKKFFGKPIFYWPIKAAKQSKLFNKIIVSSDSKKILNLAKNFGADTIKRSKKLSGDKTSVHAVIRNTILMLKKQNENFDFVCYMLPTSVFSRPKDLKKTYSIIKKNRSTFVISITKYPFPPQKSVLINSSGRIFEKNKNNFKTRTQDLNEEFHDAGQIYWGTPKLISSVKNTLNNISLPYFIPSWKIQDIDTYEDWKLAELKFKLFKSLE